MSSSLNRSSRSTKLCNVWTAMTGMLLAASMFSTARCSTAIPSAIADGVTFQQVEATEELCHVLMKEYEDQVRRTYQDPAGPQDDKRVKVLWSRWRHCLDQWETMVEQRHRAMVLDASREPLRPYVVNWDETQDIFFAGLAEWDTFEESIEETIEETSVETIAAAANQVTSEETNVE